MYRKALSHFFQRVKKICPLLSNALKRKFSARVFRVRRATFVIVLFVLLCGVIFWFSSNLGAPSVRASNVLSNLGVYWDAGLTNEVTWLDWGILEPGASKNVTFYIRNEGNSIVTLIMYPSNWNPSNASNYISVTWNYRGQRLNAGETVKVVVTLSVAENIAGITDFSFDIVVLESHLATTKVLLGDMDSDGYVGPIDLSMVAAAYGKRRGEPLYNRLADLDDDGYIGAVDLSILAACYGKHI